MMKIMVIIVVNVIVIDIVTIIIFIIIITFDVEFNDTMFFVYNMFCTYSYK